eukprot:GHRQ01019010.1.p1 GENE.GHRQ01019010.1~~GHRQ01019010.1.p1  ORF type:complete len:126 (+),score=12.90 GHRQ01019010.1:317-694(+)
MLSKATVRFKLSLHTMLMMSPPSGSTSCSLGVTGKPHCSTGSGQHVSDSASEQHERGNLLHGFESSVGAAQFHQMRLQTSILYAVPSRHAADSVQPALSHASSSTALSPGSLPAPGAAVRPWPAA